MNNLNLWNPFDWGEFKDIVLSSYSICLIGGIIGLILYLFGLKKGKDIAFISPVIYLIIRIIGGVLVGI